MIKCCLILFAFALVASQQDVCCRIIVGEDALFVQEQNSPYSPLFAELRLTAGMDLYPDVPLFMGVRYRCFIPENVLNMLDFNTIVRDSLCTNNMLNLRLVCKQK